MEDSSKQARASESVPPGSRRARIEMNRSNSATTYWGILCRTCRQMTAFDIYPCVSFEYGAANMKPSAIRCDRGHNHIYFPRDFRLRPSAIAISDAVIQENCEAFRAINPSSPASWNRSIVRSIETETNRESGIPPGALENGEARPAKLAPDPRRRIAQIAAKERWTNWALRKAM